LLNKTYQEHLSLNWILNHHKYVKLNDKFYLSEKVLLWFFTNSEGDCTIHNIENKANKKLIALDNE